MANTLTQVTPKLLAQGLMALRQQAIMPRLVNRSYDTLAAQKGKTIDIPIPSAIGATAVTPGAAYPTAVDSSPTVVNVTLDQWYEAPFHLSDSDKMQVMEGYLPMVASEAIKSLANQVDTHILSKYTGVYGFTGTAGTTPFATSINEGGTSARLVLNRQLSPSGDRRYVLEPGAEANALKLSNIIQADQRGDQGGIIEGRIGRIIGADWYMDQNMPTHTAGTAWLTGYSVATGGATAGNSTMTVINGSIASGTILVGDVFTVSGSTQNYVITSQAAAVTATVTALANVAIFFSPSLATTVASGAALTVVGTHVVNLAFHRDAFAFASRPLQRDADAERLGSIVEQAVDPVSGIALRLEVSRQYKTTRYSFDILWGAGLVRAPLACRILG